MEEALAVVNPPTESSVPFIVTRRPMTINSAQ